jgi:hypothetical protein
LVKEQAPYDNKNKSKWDKNNDKAHGLIGVIEIFSSPYANLIRRPFSISYADLKSLFANPRAKNNIFPHIRALTVVQHVYM